MCSRDLNGDAYSLALLLQKHMAQPADYKILATAPTEEILKTGKNGVFPKGELLKVPMDLHEGNLVPGAGPVADWFKVADSVCSRMAFKPHELQDGTYPGDEVFDLILCRGVFSQLPGDAQGRLLSKFHRSAKKGAWLVISSEDLVGDADLWEKVEPTLMRKI